MSTGICFVSSHAKQGGSERYLETLLSGLPSEAVHSVVSLEQGSYVEVFERLAPRVHVLSTAGSAVAIGRSALALARLLRRDRPQVVHANGVKAAVVVGLATLAAPVPAVWVKHDFSWDGWVARVTSRRMARVVGVSAAVVEALAGIAQVEIVPNAVDVGAVDRSEAARALRTEIGAPPTAPVVALIGRLHPAKGHLELLGASAGLVSSVPGFHIVFAGADDATQAAHAAAVRAVAAASQVPVHFLGHRDDVERVIAGADVVVVPSVADERGMGREGFGLAAAEAMALGTPVVGYRDGGLPEVVGECGLLVTPGDRGALSAAIAAVVTGGSCAESLAACGRARAEAEFNPRRLIEQMTRIYGEVAR